MSTENKSTNKITVTTPGGATGEIKTVRVFRIPEKEMIRIRSRKTKTRRRKKL